jgi:branched-chain amino acid transport system substrate-binding protein
VNPSDLPPVSGYVAANLAALTLKNCGDDLTRENLVHQVTSLRDVHLPLLAPGVTITIKPDEYQPYNKVRMARFDGKSWEPIGELVDIPKLSGPN